MFATLKPERAVTPFEKRFLSCGWILPAFVASFWLVALSACGEVEHAQEPPGSSTPVEWDSVGVRILEAPRTVLETTLRWNISDTPDLELGGGAGQQAYQFRRIAGITGLSDGSIVVLDRGSRELRWFDASGEHVRTFGGSGRGPGQFLDPLLVPQFQPDSLLVFDAPLMRFTWVALDGSGGTVTAPPQEPFVGTPQMAIGSRALFRSTPGLRGCEEDRNCEIPMSLHWVGLSGSRFDTLNVFNRRMLNYRGAQRFSLLLDGPLDQRGLAAAGPEGAVVEGGPQYELRQFDASDQLVAVFRVAARNMESPEAALNSFVQRARGDADELARIYRLMSMPDVLPAFQTLRVDHLGWYWGELFRAGQEDRSKWLVFDPEGRARGVVEIPPELEVHDIGEDWILGRRVDGDGLEHVSRHRLHRHDAGSSL